MTDISKFPEISFPKGKLTEEYDTIVATGELMWVKTDGQFCSGDDKLQCRVKISKETYTKLTKMKADGGRKLCGVGKQMILDEDGDKTEDVDYYYINMSNRPTYVDKETKETVNRVIPVRMYNDKNTQVEVGVGNGSTGRVKGSLWYSDFKDKKQASLNLQAIQLYSLIPFGGSNSDVMDDFDFDESDIPDFDNDAPASVPAAPQPPETEDFDDDIPFN